MNRFSPKQTLSNFVTAVRVTVDSVNKYFFTATLLVTAMSFSGAVQAQPVTFNPKSSGVPSVEVNNPPAPVTTAGAPPINQVLWGKEWAEGQRIDRENQTKDRIKLEEQAATYCNKQGPPGAYSEIKCESARSKLGLGRDRNEQECTNIATELSKWSDLATESCTAIDKNQPKDCIQKVAMCNDAETQANEYNEESDSESTDYCDAALASTCPQLVGYMNGREFKTDKKDAESDRLDAKKELDRLMDEERKDKADSAKQQLEAQEQQENGEATYQKRQSALNKEMVDSLEGIANDQKKAFKDAQAATDAMEIEFVNMRAEARAAIAAITMAEEKQKVFCTEDADSAYQKAEDARRAAEKKGRKNLGTAVSGASKRNKTAIKRQQQIDYLKYFEQCMGKHNDASLKITEAKLAKEAKEKSVAEKTKIIEQKRAQMQADLQQMESEASNQKSKVVENIQKKFNDLQAEKARIDLQNQRRLANISNNNLQANLSMQNRLAEANRRLMTTEKDAAIALTRMSCAGRNARRSETQQEKAQKAYGGAVSYVKKLTRICEKSKACGGPPEECTEALKIKADDYKLDRKNRRQLKDGDTKH